MDRAVVVADRSPRKPHPCNGSGSSFMSNHWRTSLAVNRLAPRAELIPQDRWDCNGSWNFPGRVLSADRPAD